MNDVFYKLDDNGNAEIMPGIRITSALAEAQAIAAYRSARQRREDPSIRTLASYIVSFEFNGVTVKVSGTSNLNHLQRDWERGLNGYLGENPVVGPHPKPELSAEELANDARIEAENQARRETEKARYQAEAKAHHDRVEARMANAPKMKFAGLKGRVDWRKWLKANKDSYGIGIMHYAERWARMMQLEMSEGKSLEEIWSSTSHEADLEGMSGFTQSAATHMLTICWVHGAELRRLHNARWGSDTTEGTVNSAILHIRED